MNQLRNSEHKTFASEVRTVLTIHNLLNQGNGPPSLVSFADLPADSFENLFEFWGQANCFKAGLLSADVVNTVSRTYAQKICQTAEYGFGLEGVLKAQRDSAKLTGIVNGIDEGRWAMPGFKYDGSDPGDEVLRAKHAMRERVYGQWGWRESDDPVIAFRGRWDNQKLGPLKDEPFEATFLAIAEVAKLIIVTWGIPDFPSELLNLWDRLNSFAKARPDRILINPEGLREQHETKAHYTIADFFFMPSKYEPCGLAQQECQRFGTIPIVRRTGGLADTVAEERSTAFPSPNGYVFPDMNRDSMLAAVRRAVHDFRDMTRTHNFIKNTLLQRNGWDTRLDEYESLYGITNKPRV